MAKQSNKSRANFSYDTMNQGQGFRDTAEEIFCGFEDRTKTY